MLKTTPNEPSCMTRDELTAIRQALEPQHGALVTPIAMRSGSKAIFLLDEIHNRPELIDNNIRMAHTLIQLAGKTVVGVEGCAGDKITLQDLMCPSEDGRCFGGRTRFALAML